MQAPPLHMIRHQLDAQQLPDPRSSNPPALHARRVLLPLHAPWPWQPRLMAWAHHPQGRCASRPRHQVQHLLPCHPQPGVRVPPGAFRASSAEAMGGFKVRRARRARAASLQLMETSGEHCPRWQIKEKADANQCPLQSYGGQAVPIGWLRQVPSGAE